MVFFRIVVKFDGPLEIKELPLGRLVNLYVDICLLRAGPQDLPASLFLVLLTGVISVVTGTLVIVESFATLGDALAAQLLDILLLLGFLRLALQRTGKPERFLQTTSALFGTGVLLNLIMMPLQLLEPTDSSGFGISNLGGLFYLLLILWALVITGHIFRQALEVRMAAAIAIALGYFLAVDAIVQKLFVVG